MSLRSTSIARTGLGQLLVAGEGRHVFRFHAAQVFSGGGGDEDGMRGILDEHGGDSSEFVQRMHHGRIFARHVLKLYLGERLVKGAPGAEGQGVMVHGLGLGQPRRTVGNQNADDEGEHHLAGHREFHHQHQGRDRGVGRRGEEGGHAHQGIGNGVFPRARPFA